MIDFAQIERDSVIKIAKEYHTELAGSTYGRDRDQLLSDFSTMHHLVGELLRVINEERAL